MLFTWDPKKAAINVQKHGVGFHEAATVLDDPLSTTFPDEEHSGGESRFVSIGVSSRGRLLVVAHTGTAETIRVISAGVQRGASEYFMKKTDEQADDLRPEYDFASMRAASGANM